MRFIVSVLLAVLPVVAHAQFVDGIYWTSGDSVYRSSLDGSDTERLASGLTTPAKLYVSSESILVATTKADSISEISPLGTVSTLVNVGPSQPRDVTREGDDVYIAASSLDRVLRYSLSTGQVTQLSDDSGRVFPNSVQVYGGDLYWVDGGIWRTDLSSLNTELVVAAPPSTRIINDLFITDAGIYWSTRDLALTRGGVPEPGTIRHSDFTGAGETVILDGLIFPVSLHVVDATIFFADLYTGKIQKYDLESDSLTDVISGVSGPVGIFVLSNTPTIEISTLAEIECTANQSGQLTAKATFSNNAADPISSINWYLNGQFVGSGESLMTEAPLGTNQLLVRGTTSNGAEVEVATVVTVIDSQGPEINISFSDKFGRPVNEITRNGLHQLTFQTVAIDACEGELPTSATGGVSLSNGDQLAIHATQQEVILGTTEFSVNAFATDSSGNESSEEAVLLIVD